MGFKPRAPSAADPGYFAVLRELRAKRQQGADRASRIAARVAADTDKLVAAGWAGIADPGFVRSLYEAVAKTDPAIELALARIDACDALSLLGLRTAGLAAIAPLIASIAATDRPHVAIQLAHHAPDPLGRPIAALRTLARGDGFFAGRALEIIAGAPDSDDRRWALSRAADLDDDEALAIRARAAIAGEPGFDGWIVDTLRAQVRGKPGRCLEAIERGEARYVRRSGPTELAPVIQAAGARRLTAAIEPLVELLWSFDVFEVCEALAAIGDRSAAAPLGRYLASLGGDPVAAAPYRVFAENALSVLGEPQPLDGARAILDQRVPRRFGYIEAELYRVYAAAMAALVDRGSEADRRRVAGFLDIPLALLRTQAIAACEKLGESTPALVVFDESRIARSDEATLLAALDNRGAINKSAVVAALVARGSAEARRTAISFARRRLEAQVNTWIDEPYDAMPDFNELIAAIEGLDESDRALLQGTSSEWIQALVLDQSDMEYPLEPSELAAGVSVSIDRFDRLPFVFGTHINGLAISPDGSRLALLGDSFCKIVCAETGAFIAQLNPGWTWGYDCAFTADGKTLLACFHGGHVETYDAATGVRIRDLRGHGGVPDGVKRVAMSPDQMTAVSVGSDGKVIGWDLASGERLWTETTKAGSCEAVAFSPDGTRVIASHVTTGAGQTDYLSIHDPRTGASEHIEMPSSIWAIAFSPDGERVALGGASGRVRLCRNDLTTARELELAKTTRLAFTADGQYLVGCSSEGVVKRWRIAGSGAGEVLLETDESLWTLVIAPSGQVWTIGSAGVLHRIGAPAIAGETHAAQITGLARSAAGVLSSSWDGRVLEWPADGGVGRERLAIEGRVNRLASDAERTYAATARGLYAIGQLGAEQLASNEHDEIAVSGPRLARNAGADLEICSLPTMAIEATVRVGSDDISAVCAWRDGFLAGSEEGEVSYVAGGQRRWTVVDHGHDRLDHGNSHKDVCGLTATTDGFVSSSNDDTVRLYRVDGDSEPERLSRLHVDAGIFNKLAISPDGSLLAVPVGSELALFRTADGHRLASLRTYEHFENEELTVGLFVTDGHLIVGTENGHLFSVRIER